jgi:hypothetical protein
MRASTLLLPAMAMLATAAPKYPEFDLKHMKEPGAALETLSNYFNLIAYKTKAAKVIGRPPVCDVSTAQMPIAPEPLAAPSKGLKPHHVALGRGTQNYTCADNRASSVPEAAGAVATLFNISCLASVSPELVTTVANMAIHFSVDEAAHRALGPTPWPVSGVHYFQAPGVAYFNLNEGSTAGKFGEAPCQKNGSTVAPAAAAVGPKGEKAVPWLKLNVIEGATQDIKEIYRVDTVGGSPPATCEGMDDTFTVEYAAVYWFWAGKIVEDEE